MPSGKSGTQAILSMSRIVPGEGLLLKVAAFRERCCQAAAFFFERLEWQLRRGAACPPLDGL